MNLLTILLIVAVYTLVLVLAAYGVSRSLTLLSIKWAGRMNAIDEAGERSCHEAPTPRLGGIGLTAGLYISLIAVAVMLAAPSLFPPILQPYTSNGLAALDWPMLGGMAGGLAIAFVVGIIDDLKGLPAVGKLIGQFIAAAIPVALGLRLTKIHLPGMDDWAILSAAVGITATMLWLVAMMNVVNFMDGINGLAGRFGQLVAVFSFVSVFNWLGWGLIIPLVACLYGSAEGFLAYNMRRTRTFMGDCGSQPLGLFVGMLGVVLTLVPTTHPPPIVGFIIIVSPFLFDVGYTLIRRIAGGRNLLVPHREHLYQRHLIATSGGHDVTRSAMEGLLIATGITGALYIRFCYAPGSLTWQLILLGVTALFLIMYVWTVLRTERSDLAQPG